MPDSAAYEPDDDLYALGVCTDNPPLDTAAHGSREIAEALGFEPDNHHNALLCPYCGDQRQKIEREVREQVAGYFDRLSGDRNPDDPEGSAAYSRWAMNAADRIRHPERYEGCAANAD